MLFLCFLLAVWLGISVEVDVDRITILLPPSSLPSCYILSLPTFLSLVQVTVIHQSIPEVPTPPGNRGAFAHIVSSGGGALAILLWPPGAWATARHLTHVIKLRRLGRKTYEDK